ncbi:MAG: hypothetical protein NWE94_03795 [Candidatus Bathyarchaeota archaeon]|nr:hypothetical protein [Candidatus Bathyarchaeota archaeon]
MLKTLKPAKPVFIHGAIIVAALVITQLLLDAAQNSFLLYMPPIGFAFFLFTQYGIQPIIIGALNVAVLQRLHKLDEWQTGFWLNGLFLLLTFTTINIILQTVTGLPFAPCIAIIDIVLLPYPFGYLGKFSNRQRKKSNNNQLTNK